MAVSWASLHVFRPGLLLSDGAALLGRPATDLGLDRTELGDPGECLGGDRRRATRSDLVERPAHMAPAEGRLDLAGFGEPAIAGIAVDLQDAPEALEMS